MKSNDLRVAPHCATRDIGNKNIGNTFLTRVILVVGGKGRQGRTMRIQETQRYGSEGNEPAFLVFGYAYQLSDQGFTEVDESPAPLDLPIGTHPSDFGEGRIFDVTESFGIGPRRRNIQASRGDLAKGLVGTHVIILLSETIERLLLSLRRDCWRLHRLLLGGTVQSLMPAILFRVSRINTLWHNTYLNPPGRERRESPGAYGGERRAIITTFARGKPYSLKMRSKTGRV